MTHHVDRTDEPKLTLSVMKVINTDCGLFPECGAALGQWMKIPRPGKQQDFILMIARSVLAIVCCQKTAYVYLIKETINYLFC